MNNDSEWIAKIVEGDRRAMDAFVRRTTPLVQRRVAAILLRCGAFRDQPALAELARDIVQEVLVALFEDGARHLKRWDPERGTLETYLGRLAAWRANDYLRKLRRRPALYGEEWAVGQLATGPDQDVERVFSARELLHRVMSAVEERLTARGRMLLQLIYVQGLSVQETAREAGLSAAAVHTWRSRLRKLLLAELRLAS